jgi:hypothetical protein
MVEATKAGHRDHHIWGSVSYWLGDFTWATNGTATRVRIEVGFGPERQDFDYDITLAAPVNLMRALDLAVEAGDRHARAEMRACMGIKEPRE